MGGKKAHPVAREWYWLHGDPVGIWKGLDWPSVRRGRQVYSEVFAPCHSLAPLTFNHLQAVMTKEEIRALAQSYEITSSDPEKDGTYATRKCKPADQLPAPYPNSQAAAFANNGAEPPDLKDIVYGREEGPDYIFALMTGYHWADTLGLPPFVNELKPGQFWNPYFKGCVLAMPPPLSDGMLDYDDGTPATVSQMSKDVVAFLKWTAEPEWDERKTVFWKCWTTTLLMTVLFHHYAQKFYTWKVFQRVKWRYWAKVGQ